MQNPAPDGGTDLGSIHPRHKLSTDRDVILETLRENHTMLGDTEELERERKMLNALASSFEQTKARYEEVAVQISQIGIQKRELGRFIRAVAEMPECITDFSEAMWGSMVDHVTVYDKDNLVFTMTGGMEIRA